MSKFGKSYPTIEEYNRRLKNFQETERQVRVHNEIEFGRNAGFKLGLNMFADWDASEIDGERGDRMFRGNARSRGSGRRNLETGSPAVTRVLPVDEDL